MSPQLLQILRGLIPLFRLLAGMTKTTADDTLVSFLESVVNAPTAQAAAMLTAAHATAGHVASFGPQGAAPAADEGEDKPKRKAKAE
jgi:hypothetical protein